MCGSGRAAKRMQLEVVLLNRLLVIPITPYGTALALYPVHSRASSLPVSVASIRGGSRRQFQDSTGRWFLVLFFGLASSQLVFTFRWRPDEILLLLFGAAMACMHRRFLLLFVPFFAPQLATTLARWSPDGDDSPKGNRLQINAGIIAAVAVGMAQGFPSRAAMATSVGNQFPVRLWSICGNIPRRSSLNSYGFGGCMVWAGHEVFIEGRSELFEVAGVLADYAHIVRLRPGAMKVLAKYGIRSCLLHRDEPLAALLASDPDWRSVYSDNLAALYVKRDDAEAVRTVP